MNIYKRVIDGVKWHAFESITYQILLCSHRFTLYKVLGPTEFGMIGCIFAGIYGLIFLSNLGFNDSIIAFFLDISSSKNACNKFFIQYAIPHICMLMLFPIAIWFLPFHMLSSLSSKIFFAAAALFIAESLRITLRTLLQLTFINKQLTYIDLGGLCVYLTIVWSCWLHGLSLTPCLVLIPLAAISYLQILLLGTYTISWYMKLPTHTTFLPLYRRVIRVRLFSYMHHSLSSHIMSNFVVPYSAYIGGLEYASLAKLVTSTSQLITTVLKHTVGFSSMALFSYFKYASHDEKISIFRLTNKFLFKILFISILLCTILYTLVSPYIESLHIHTGFIVFLLLVLTFENCFITCESAYLSEEQPEILFITYIISISTLYILFYYYSNKNIGLFMSSFLIVRIFSLSLLTFILTNRWKSS